MGKRTQRSELPMLGVFLIAGGFFAAAAVAQQPMIQVGDGSGSTGGTATFSVTLNLNGSAAQVAATQNDISFDINTPVRVSTNGYCTIHTTTQCSNDSQCPDLPDPFTGKEPCIPANGPNCSVNPDLGKGGFFSFLPSGCIPTTAGNCTGIRALIVAVDNLTAIPDGSTLYTCTVQIAQGATAPDYALTNSNVSAGDPNQQLVCGPIPPATAECEKTDGKITVLPGGQPYVVCDVDPQSGDNAGQFGDGSIDIFDYRAQFGAGQLGVDTPADGTARFSAMDSVDLDSPPTCGGDGSIDIFDYRQCFAVGQLGATNYVRTGTGSSCTSVEQPQ
jgi:hypothetical protein